MDTNLDYIYESRFQKYTINSEIILKERIKYFRQKGSKILRLQIFQECFLSGLIDEIDSELELPINVEELYINQIGQLYGLNYTIFNYCLANLSTLTVLDINLSNELDQKQIKLLKKLPQLKQLNLDFLRNDQNRNIKLLFEALSSLKCLQSLKLVILSKDHQELDQDLVSSFPIIPSLKEFSFTLDYHKMNMKQFKELLKKIFKFTKLEIFEFSIKDCEMPEKWLSTFFTSIKKVKFNLKQFHFIYNINVKADETIINNLAAFLSTQKQLETLEISGFLFNKKQITPFNDMIICQNNLKSLSINLEMNNLKNIVLRQFASSLSKLKELEEIKIVFDLSNYSGKGIIEIGEAFKSLRSLRDLRLEFPGSVNEKMILPFAECIAQCKKLNYLFIFFSGSGYKFNKVLFLSQTPTSTIFQNPYLKLTPCHPFATTNSKESTFYNYALFQLVIANQFTNIQYLEYSSLSQFYFLNVPQKFRSQALQQEQNLISKCVNLKSLWIQKTLNQSSNTKDFDSLIKLNTDTLVSVHFDFQDVNNLAPLETKQNILSITYCPQKIIEIKNILQKFPKLVYLNINHCFLLSQLNEEEIQQVIQSDVIIEIQQNTIGGNELSQILIGCINLRKSALHTMIVYKKFIQNYLIYQQSVSHVDLWIELLNN